MDEKKRFDVARPKEADELEKGQNVVQSAEASAITKAGLVVHPQPTSDPLDPLNWSWMKKHSILAIVMFK
jgi:hypothetical protein